MNEKSRVISTAQSLYPASYTAPAPSLCPPSYRALSEGELCNQWVPWQKNTRRKSLPFRFATPIHSIIILQIFYFFNTGSFIDLQFAERKVLMLLFIKILYLDEFSWKVMYTLHEDWWILFMKSDLYSSWRVMKTLHEGWCILFMVSYVYSSWRVMYTLH